MPTHDRLHAPAAATGSLWLDGDFLTQENEGVDNLVTFAQELWRRCADQLDLAR
jgi:hypothetical protein